MKQDLKACNLGKGKKTCAYLATLDSAFYCCKGNKSLEKSLNDRKKETFGSNCPGFSGIIPKLND